MKFAKRFFKILIFVVPVLAIAFLFYQCSGSHVKVDEKNMRLIQFAQPQDEDPVAVIKTNQGDITVILYPAEAPKAVENFIGLAKQGYYKDNPVFNIQSDVAVIAGADDPDGSTYQTIYDNQPFDNEYSDNLWPFTGALGGFGTEKGKMDSRFFLLGNFPVDDKTAETMKSNGYPEPLIEQFKASGGVAAFSKKYTIFGQVIEGQELVNQMVKAEAGDLNKPKEPIIISDIVIKKYVDIK